MDGAGLVAIMHVDVAGSTALATRRGDELAQRVLAETKLHVRQRAEARGGREIDAVGDAMMLTFESARAAIGAAEEIQEGLAERERAQPEETLRVRIGINVGEVLARDGHPFGAAVNAGARVMAKAEGGQILVSELTRRLAGTMPGTSFRDRGRHAFKGFDEPWRLYEVEWPGAPPQQQRPRRRSPRWALVAAVVGAAAIAVAVAAVLVSRSGGGSATEVPPDSLAEIDPGAGRVAEHFPVGSQPSAAEGANTSIADRTVAAGLGAVWVANRPDGTITRVDEKTGAVSTVAPVPGIKGLAVGAGRVWGAARDAGVVEVSPRGTVDNVRTVPATAGPVASVEAVAAPGRVYVTANGLSTLGLVRVEPATLALSRPLSLGPASDDQSIAVGEGAIWVTDSVLNTLFRVVGSAVRRVQIADAGSVAVGLGSVWVTDETDGTLWQVDPRLSLPPRPVSVGGQPVSVAVGSGRVWVADYGGDVVEVVPQGVPRVAGRIHVGRHVTSVAADTGRVWAVVG